MTDKSGAIWFPNKRVIRTVLQVLAAIVLGLATTLGVFQLVAPQVLEAVREILPPSWYLALAGFVAFVGTFAGVLAKVMAIPQVDEFLKRFGAGSTPKNQDVPDAVETAVRSAQDRAVIGYVASPIPAQIATVEEAARRLNLDPDTLTRDQYRDGADLE